MQLAEVAVLLDRSNRQCPVEHLSRLPCTQDWTAQQRLAVVHFVSHRHSACQQFRLLEASFREPSTTMSSRDDSAQCMIRFPMTNQDQPHLAQDSRIVHCALRLV